MFGARAIKRRRDKEAELKVLTSNTNTQICKCTNMKIHIYAHTKLKADIVKTNIRSKKYNLTDKSTQNVQTKAKKNEYGGQS